MGRGWTRCARGLAISVLYAGMVCGAAFAQGTTPPLGEYCPTTGPFDSANCFFGRAPAGTRAFIYQGGFYHSPTQGASGPQCSAKTRYDGANCFLGPVPAGYEPFLYQEGWYTKANRRFSNRATDCPSKTSFDGTGCFRGRAPAGKKALVLFRNFLFTRKTSESCGALMTGASGASPLYCTVGGVPSGYQAFVSGNAWYVKPRTNTATAWRVKTDPNESDADARPVCRTDGPTRRWELAWSDEFDAQPSGKPCYTTDDQIQCVEKPYWGWSRCAGQPTGYSDAHRASWTRLQGSVFGPMRDLNKCTWQVFDSFNTWDATESEPNRQNSFAPANVRVEGGVLKLATRFHAKPATGYDCGRPLNAQQNHYTRSCPFSGANLWSISGKPWTNGHSPTNANPDARYSGRTVGYGRIEFRAKIHAVGHGAWPAVWLFVDERLDPNVGGGELDNLEFLAYDQRDPTQLLRQSATFGNALQTAHNWGVPALNYPHTSEGVGIPISVGEWHSYTVEYEPGEVRFYIDHCLRNRIVEGQIVKYWSSTSNAWEQKPFHIPKSQRYTLIIGNPASNAGYLPSWYRAWTDKESATQGSAGPNFRPTELHVDYVRYYTSPDLPPLEGARTMRLAAPPPSADGARPMNVQPMGPYRRATKRPSQP